LNRTVPDQDPAKITQLVKDHIQKEFKKLDSKNSVNVSCDHAGKWWVADPKSWNYVAAAKAVEKVFGCKPDYTREGGSIPVTLTFQEALKKSVCFL
jgi:Cys-Gly metallodipeptidase DUG1